MSNRRHGWVWVWLVLVVGALATFGLVVLYLGSMVSINQWVNYVEEMRAKGEPLTFAEVDALRASVPDEHNSALVLTRLDDRLKEVWGSDSDQAVMIFGEDEDADFFTGIPRYHLEPSKEFIEKHSDLLNDLSALQSLFVGRFELEKGLLERMAPSLGGLRNAGKLLHLAGLVALLDDDVAGAIRQTQLQFRVAASLHEHPTLIGRMVQIAFHYLAVQSIEQILRAHTVGNETLLLLDRELQRALDSRSIRLVLQGERASLVEAWEWFLAEWDRKGLNQWPGLIQLLRTTGQLPSEFARSNQLYGCKLMSRLLQVSDSPLEALRAAQEVDQEVEDLRKTRAIAKVSMIPGLGRAIDLDFRSKTQLDSARGALAAERFRLGTGAFPRSWEELVPAYLGTVPVDPFDGQALRIVHTIEGITIYSIGNNRIDDGGIVVRTQQEGTQNHYLPDIGFRLLSPEKRGVVILDVPPPPDEKDE